MTISPSKKVSVVVPNYNYARYLKKRIDSILRQTYPIYELIILDDASTDGSVEEILRVLEKHNLKLEEDKTVNNRGEKKYKGGNENFKVRLVVNEKNSGKAMAQWKKGFELAEGDYVWIAEADDLCSRQFLTEAMKGFRDPEVVLSYTESAIINSAGFLIAPNFRWSRDKEKTGHYKVNYVKGGRTEIKEIMAVRCTIPNVSAVVFKKKEIFLEYLEESLKFNQVGDWYFYLRVLENGKISYNRKALNRFRVHGSSKTSQSKKDWWHYQEIMDMHKMLAVRYNLTEPVVRWMKNEEERVRSRMERNKNK